MSRKLIVIVVLSAALGLTLLVAYAKTPGSRTSYLSQSSQTLQSSNTGIEDVASGGDLAGQPEAVKLSRRLGGDRFKAKSASAVILSGVITTGTDQENVQITRSRTPTGEHVKLLTPNSPAELEWEAGSAAVNGSSTLNAVDRGLLGRLIFDSVDQFILAQLRGASYYVVARNVRPDDAPENYSGPIWDVVRIDDPAAAELNGSQSRWRLYYLNQRTGLIDKVVSELQGQRIEASFSGWTRQGAELSPSTVTWTSNGQTLMTFTVTNVSFNSQSAQ